MSFDVRDKTALVTGANRGIGKAIVESLLKHGAQKVYAAVRSVDSASALVATHGPKVVAVELDLSKPDTIRTAAAKAKDVTLVINNAGVFRGTPAIHNDTFDALNYALEVNLFGLVHMAQAFAPVLKANAGGAFVQVNSIVSVKAFSEFATYCASKAAAYSITQSLRESLAEQGTAVVSVHPGPIATDMGSEAGLDDIAEPAELVGEAIIDALRAGRFHVFPGSMATQIGDAYESFAKTIVEAAMAET